ncbi:hypothetical protein BGZ65_009181, partial [Modicella reniformis]
MNGTIPTYQNACVAPIISGSSVWLIGVTGAGKLEAYSVSLTDIDSPSATLVTTQFDPSFWSSDAQRACFNYPGNQADPNSPIMMQQFGRMSYFTNVYPNGTVNAAYHFPKVGFFSNKLFSFTAGVENLNWYTALSNVSGTTKSAWTGLRLNATRIANSSRDVHIAMYPTPNPRLSVGIFEPASTTPIHGYLVVFGDNNDGTLYTTMATATPKGLSEDQILTLARPQPVDMAGITFSNDAIPVSMTHVAYILDRASDGSTVLYSINPNQGVKLQRVDVQGDVPWFSPNMTATALNSQIVVYTPMTRSSTAPSRFNSFDTDKKTWAGPGLITPESKIKAPLVVSIIGGVVGGLVVIAIIFILVIRHRRKSSDRTINHASSTASVQGQQQQQHYLQQPMQQYNPRPSYISQSKDVPVFQQQQQQYVDPSQERYTYMPPPLTTFPQYPNIFQPQVDPAASPTHTQPPYGSSDNSAGAPYTQIPSTFSNP